MMDLVNCGNLENLKTTLKSQYLRFKIPLNLNLDPGTH